MTSPSLKNPRITLQSTLRSTCAKALFRAGAVLAFVAAPGAIAWSAAPQAGPVIVASKSKTRVALAQPLARSPLADEGSGPSPALAARRSGNRRAASAAGRDAAAPLPAARMPGHAAQGGGLVQTNFFQEQPLDPYAETDTSSRPIRKITEILPYDSYEPDPDAAAQTDCATNLCPCPEGVECSACCPKEKFLRRLGRAPGDSDTPFVPRNFAHIHYCWEPTNLYHLPIYFEDVPLERYGHTRHYLIQPFVSGAKFAAQLLGLPYQMTICPPCTKQYSLGYYRPGEFAPYKYYQVPLNVEAALVEAGVIAGGYFLFAPGVGP